MIIALVLNSLFLILVATSLSLYYKLCWKPISVQKMLRSQGLNGPSYKFIYGTTKEMIKMIRQAMSTPLDSSQHDVFPRVMPHVDTWIKLYGNNFVTWIGDQPEIVVTEPELVNEILTNREGVYRKIKPKGYLKKLLGDGLLVAEGEKWSRLRKLANHSFHGECLKDMVPAMVTSVETMLKGWRSFEGKEVDVSKEFKLLTSEIISRTAFGSSYEEGKNIFTTMTKLSVIVMRNAFKFTLSGKIYKSKDAVESDQIEQSMRDSIMNLIRQRQDKVKSGQTENYGSDYLGSLLEVHHDMNPNNRISLNDIIDECKVFYIAGHETSTNTLSWSILLLSIYTDWQEKAREEVFQLLGRENPTTESIARLRILTMIINEALRLYCPVLYVPRRTHCKTKLGKYEIPANVNVNVPPLALQRNPNIWGGDAHVFNPARFSEGLGNKKATKGNATAFLPFSLGPRMCVGFNFAANELKIAMSMILQRYKFTVSPNYVHSPAQMLTLYPQHGVQIILQSV